MALLSNNLVQEILDVAESYADKEKARLDRLAAARHREDQSTSSKKTSRKSPGR